MIDSYLFVPDLYLVSGIFIFLLRSEDRRLGVSQVGKGFLKQAQVSYFVSYFFFTLALKKIFSLWCFSSQGSSEHQLYLVLSGVLIWF